MWWGKPGDNQRRCDLVASLQKHQLLVRESVSPHRVFIRGEFKLGPEPLLGEEDVTTAGRDLPQ